MKKISLTLPIMVMVLFAESQPFICGTSLLTDADGFQYHTVLMGTQCWTQENMRTIHYANGLPDVQLFFCKIIKPRLTV